MKRIFLIALILFFASYKGYAQNKDSLKVKELLDKSFSVLYADPAQANTYAKEALKISKKIDECVLIAESMNLIAFLRDRSPNVISHY